MLTVTLMRWQTHFEFDKAQLNIESAFEHVDSEGKLWRLSHDGDGLEPVNLRRLCQQQVSMISVDALTLILGFSNGDLLRIFTEIGPYECGQLHDDEGNIIVF